jgi:hypothetical protein
MIYATVGHFNVDMFVRYGGRSGDIVSRLAGLADS